MKQTRAEFILSPETVDRVSELFAGALAEAGADRRDILRIRLSLEDILGSWLEKLEGAAVCCQTTQRFGRTSVEVSVQGIQIDPEDRDGDFLLSSRLLAQAGLALDYSYKSGKNQLLCSPLKKARFGPMTKLLTAILAAFVIGGIVRTLPESVQAIAVGVLDPIFNTILSALRAISSPLIFLSICWGIVSIGDLATVGRIGKRLITAMVIGTFVVGTALTLLAFPFFRIVLEKGAAALDGLSDIYAMVLGIVPSDIVSPFMEGNALQIVFLGVCIGAALLVLGERVSAVRNLVVQANEIVSFLMGAIGKIVPVFVFLSLFNLMLFDAEADILGILKVFAFMLPGCLFVMLAHVAMVAIRFRVSPVLLIKKLLPTYLIALSTGSSAAAFATNMETCTDRLGLPAKVANFAIPLGQIIYMPGEAVSCLVLALCMAEYYDTPITVIWLVTAILTSGILSMAAPPIPGGALSVYTILFLQLGIPSEAVALAVALNSVLDLIATSTNLLCLQTLVTSVAGSLKMLDERKLSGT